MTDFKEELKKVPELPGVYLMHDADDRIIYVGKAIVLRNRLRSYFNNTPHNERITQMIARIARFEFIVTASEYEALLLECNLIKKHRPKYNVLLKDDKNYPYIKVTSNETFPRVFIARKKIADGAVYFGPYYLSYTVKSTLDTLSRVFPTRRCTKKIDPKKPTRVCLNYHIGLCPGPCAGYVSEEEYHRNVESVCDFLAGRNADIIKRLQKEMLEASAELDFERAAELRDRIKGLEVVSEKQKIMLRGNDSIDAVAVVVNETDAVAQVFHVEGGKILGRDFFVLEAVGGSETQELYMSFLTQYYGDSIAVPAGIYIAEEIPADQMSMVSEMFTAAAGRKITVVFPKKGKKREICDMALQNASIALDNYETTKRIERAGSLAVLEKLRDVCNLDGLPLRIESFDISNLGDSEIDGSMVVFENGKPKKSDYRRFRIRTLEKRSDVGAMNEMLTRRFKKLAEGEISFGGEPDLILMDGGITQIHEAMKVLGDLGLSVPIFGMVKDDKHRSRGIMSAEGNEFRLEEDPDIWRFVTDVQNETHRFAIEYNRKLTEKRYKKSPLDGIKGIGDKRKVALLRKFGSVKGIREASPEEIASVGRIPLKLAETIKTTLLESAPKNSGAGKTVSGGDANG
ncbi:MAG: excinuclease ABC subunit UvrC [Clostridia bacterium]|nr:excinuclease ABC subunit UvrC [Clostridia bacterium]